MMTIKDLVKDKYVEFAFFRNGFFYYNIIVVPIPQNHEKLLKQEIYQFPVPLDDIGNATLLIRDKAIIYMRYIRKAMQDNTLIKIK